ncbi:MAG: DUF4248 domain-containing protein [Bacteroidetes bacterium]|jgi:hypothetical protein|nr:MAG: DUF4248 domain-containing protein [Bacteroidota bacterium]
MGNNVKLVRKNITQLKDEYETSYKTMIKMLLTVPNLKVKNRKVRDYSPKEVEMIYSHLGVPGKEFDEA